MSDDGSMPQALHRLPRGGAGVYALAPDSLVARRVNAVTQMHTLHFSQSNPQMLEMFTKAERNCPPYSYGLQGAGAVFQMEFAGKFLTHAVQVWKVSQDPELKAVLTAFVSDLGAIQAENGNGYLSSMPDGSEFGLGKPAKADDGTPVLNPWEAWGHYHLMTGLLLWHEATGEATAMTTVTKMADLLCTLVGNDPQKLHKMTVYASAHGGPPQYSGVNAVIIDSMAWLFRVTCDAGHPVERYREFCMACLAEWALPHSPDFLRQTLKGVQYYQLSVGGRRWECLHSIMGLAELSWAPGTSGAPPQQAMYAKAFQDVWWSLAQYERKPQGAMMSQEGAKGSPYANGSQETCCVVAWSALSVKMLEMTSNSLVADELELSLLNAAMMFIHPSGAWITYDSQVDFHTMGGQAGRQNFFTAGALAWQSKPGTSQCGCCTVNGPRLLGMLAEWGLMSLGPTISATPGYALNFFGAGTLSSTELELTLETDYPFEPNVQIMVSKVAAGPLALWVRIPAWSKKTTVRINSQPQSEAIVPGKYLKLTRRWAVGDKIAVIFDFRIRGWTDCTDAETQAVSEPNPFTPGCTITVAKAVEVGPSSNLPALPPPVWDSSHDGHWPTKGRHFAGAEPPLVIPLPALGKIGTKPTTMMGWVFAPSSMSASSITKEVLYVFSCGGADAMRLNGGKDDCRALAVTSESADYIGRGEGDVGGIMNSPGVWKHALTDTKAWHHLAVTDDNAHILLYLDGKLVGSHPHSDPARHTSTGFIVGGFADCNRAFVGWLSGVRFYTSCLAPAAIQAAQQATAPTILPPAPPPRPVKTALYYGPLLLTFDPRFNGLQRHDLATLDATAFSKSPTRISTDTERLPCNLLLEFSGAASGGGAVRLCDFGSAGMTGRFFTSWLSLDYHSPAPTAPFTRSNLTRTFVLVEHPPLPRANALDAEEEGVYSINCAIKLLPRPGVPGRRTVLRHDWALQQLRHAVGLTEDVEVALLWLDDKGDWVALESELDLCEARRVVGRMRVAGGRLPLLRLRVQEVA